METFLLANRIEAGQRLAQVLEKYRKAPDTLVLGLPRGGVVTAGQTARDLGLPLDILVAKKLGAPNNPEFAIGAIAGNVRVLEPEAVKSYGVPQAYLVQETERVVGEVKRREREYRGNLTPLDLRGRTVLIIDDGMATGITMEAAVQLAHAQGARHIIAAAPICSPDAVKKLAKQVDEVVCVGTPPLFMSVGQFYVSFPEVSDEEVKEILEKQRISPLHV